jgi:hypothetical protein
MTHLDCVAKLLGVPITTTTTITPFILKKVRVG